MCKGCFILIQAFSSPPEKRFPPLVKFNFIILPASAEKRKDDDRFENQHCVFAQAVGYQGDVPTQRGSRWLTPGAIHNVDFRNDRRLCVFQLLLVVL